MAELVQRRYSPFAIRHFAIRPSPLRSVAEQTKNRLRASGLESVWKKPNKPVAGWCAETLRH
jgi:hypothetical protein